MQSVDNISKRGEHNALAYIGIALGLALVGMWANALSHTGILLPEYGARGSLTDAEQAQRLAFRMPLAKLGTAVFFVSAAYLLPSYRIFPKSK